jgi:hypothetical protein
MMKMPPLPEIPADKMPSFEDLMKLIVEYGNTRAAFMVLINSRNDEAKAEMSDRADKRLAQLETEVRKLTG